MSKSSKKSFINQFLATQAIAHAPTAWLEMAQVAVEEVLTRSLEVMTQSAIQEM